MHTDDCNDGDIRLIYYVLNPFITDNPPEGLVEVCSRGQWGSVCNNGWDDSDAIVVCRQLGYDRGMWLIMEPCCSINYQSFTHNMTLYTPVICLDAAQHLRHSTSHNSLSSRPKS